MEAPATAPRRLRAWQGILTVIVAGSAGQMVGVVGVLILVGVVASSTGQLEPNHMLGLVMEPWALLAGTTVMQLTLVAVSFAVPLLVRVSWREAFGLRSTHALAFVLAPLGAIGLGPLSDLIAQTAVTAWPALDMGNLAMILGIVRASPIWVTLPLVALLPGFAEEILFRGVSSSLIREPGVGSGGFRDRLCRVSHGPGARTRCVAVRVLSWLDHGSDR